MTSYLLSVMAAGSSCSSDTESSLSSENYSSDLGDDEGMFGPLPGTEILPYQFEPTYDDDDDDDDKPVASPDSHSSSDSSPDSPVAAPTTGVPDDPSVDRVGNVNWCTCGHCSVMSTQQESICCKEVDKIKDLLADPGLADARPPCITEHPHFANACLCRTVLTISMHRHVYHYGSSDIPKDENGKFQYLACRQLALWAWQYLGRHRRVVLPSCAVSRIKQEFPSAE